MRRLSLSSVTFPAAGLALVIGACSSFGEEADDPGVEAGANADAREAAPPGTDGADGAPEPTDSGSTPPPRHVYVFGGVTQAYRAELLKNGALGAWSRVPSLDRDRQYVASFAPPVGFVIAGGSDAVDVFSSKVEIARPADGGVGPWASAPGLGKRRAAGAAASSPTHLYFSGGLEDNTPTATVLAAAIDPQGIAPWVVAGTLPAPAVRHATVVVGARLHLVGGSDGMPMSWFASLAGDGGLGEWQNSGSIDSTEPLFDHALTYAGGFLHAIGGRTFNNGPSASVWLGAIYAPSGKVTWSANSGLPEPLIRSCTVVDGSRILVLGGFVTSTVPPLGTARVFAGDVAASGAISWTTLPDMPEGRGNFGCAIR